MKVIFYQPVLFLRSEKKTNPFFDPIIEVCRKNGIEWEIWLPDARVEHGYEKSHVRDMRWFYYVDHFFYRIFHYLFRVNAGRAQVWSGFVLRQLTFHRYKTDLVVSIAGCLVHVMRSFFPHTRAADIQHGIVYSSHPGYFNAQGRIWSFYWDYPEREFWLYGQGYANVFFKNKENHQWLEGRVKVVGDVVRGLQPSTFNLQSSTSKRRLIILANQMTPDDTPEMGQKLKKVYECWLDEMADVVASHPEVSVVLRNHPRFYNIVDLSDWKAKYPWLGADQRSFDQVFPESICCVTINSTTVFDAVPYGCPSVLIDGSEAGWKNIMVDEYNYPYGKLTVQELLEMTPNDLVEMRERLQKWYNTYYTPFDAERALMLIKGEL